MDTNIKNTVNASDNIIVNTEVPGSFNEQKSQKPQLNDIFKRNLPNIIFAIILIIFTVVVSFISIVIFGLAGMSGSNNQFILSVPFVALGITVVFAIVLNLIFKFVFKLKVNWLIVIFSYLLAVVVSIILIIFQFVKMEKSSKKSNAEYPVVLQNLKNSFVLDSVKFLDNKSEKKLKVEINYHFENLERNPEIADGTLHYFLEAGFDKNNLGDYLFYVGNCQPFSSKIPKKSEYVGDKLIPLESKNNITNLNYKTVIEYEIGDVKSRNFCEFEKIYKSLNGMTFYVKIGNDNEIVGEIPLILEISNPDPYQELVNINNRVIDAIRNEDLNTLYELLSPLMRKILTFETFSSNNIIENDRSRIVAVEMTQEPEIFELNAEEKGEWAQSIIKVKRQNSNKIYSVRYMKKEGKWWLIGIAER